MTQSSAPTNLSDLTTFLFTIFTDVRVGVEHNQPAKVYAENAQKIIERFSTYQQRGVAIAGSDVPSEPNQEDGGQ